MTALDMHGASLTFLALDEAIEAALLSETPVAAWPRARILREAVVRPLPEGLSGGPAPTPSRDAVVAGQIAAVCRALIAAEDALNALDARVGDGDTGSTFAEGARAVLADLDRLPQAEPAALCRALGERLGRAAGGSSGVLLSIFFAAAGSALAEEADWAKACAAGLDRVCEVGGAGRGSRTMLDAAIPAVEALAASGLGAAARAARAGAEATAGMERAGTGRSSYLASGDLKGHPDPGAVAVATAFEALAAESK